jgi:hypothetical protein
MNAGRFAAASDLTSTRDRKDARPEEERAQVEEKEKEERGDQEDGESRDSTGAFKGVSDDRR